MISSKHFLGGVCDVQETIRVLFRAINLRHRDRSTGHRTAVDYQVEGLGLWQLQASPVGQTVTRFSSPLLCTMFKIVRYFSFINLLCPIPVRCGCTRMKIKIKVKRATEKLADLIMVVSWHTVNSSGTRNLDLSSTANCFSFLARSTTI